MERLFEVRESLLRFYAKHSKMIEKLVQFSIAWLTFSFISNHIGFMKSAAHPIVPIILAVISMFLPMTLVVLMAGVYVMIQLSALSVGVAIAAAAIFLIMFMLYFRFVPEKSIVLLLMPIAFMLKIPAVVPIVYGLTAAPVTILPIVFGIVIYYMVTYVTSYATTIEAAEKADIIGQMTTFLRQIFSNKEMWITIAAVTICLLIVYNVKRLAIDNSWKIAMVVGMLSYIVVIALGNIVMKTPASYPELIVGGVFAILIGMILEFFVFAVDYSRTERLQFEDDEYFYYVKAVPKVYVPAPEKTVKRINARQRTKTQTQTQAKTQTQTQQKKVSDEMLLEKALRDELEMQELLKDKLNF